MSDEVEQTPEIPAQITNIIKELEALKLTPTIMIRSDGYWEIRTR